MTKKLRIPERNINFDYLQQLTNSIQFEVAKGKSGGYFSNDYVMEKIRAIENNIWED